MPAKKAKETLEEELQATPEPAAEGETMPSPKSPPEPNENKVASQPQLPPASQTPISPSEEHTWALLAHLSVYLNLITGLLGSVVALIIYLVYKDRSRYIAYQALQSTVFQLTVWVGVGLVIGGIWLVTAALSLVLVGLLLIPFALLATLILLVVPLGSLIYGTYAGIQCSNGEDFRYWLIGDWLRNTYEAS
jgi:uncharacterized Tic20 family protein